MRWHLDPGTLLIIIGATLLVWAGLIHIALAVIGSASS